MREKILWAIYFPWLAACIAWLSYILPQGRATGRALHRPDAPAFLQHVLQHPTEADQNYPKVPKMIGRRRLVPAIRGWKGFGFPARSSTSELQPWPTLIWAMHCFPLGGREVLSGRTFLFDADTRHVLTMPDLHKPKKWPLSLFVPRASADDSGGTLFLHHGVSSETGDKMQQQHPSVRGIHLPQASPPPPPCANLSLHRRLSLIPSTVTSAP